ncbi:MAG: hypothetical protein HY812_17440 [Planctomycetes bacterium]|nr:hypothetical protein [Planctomycetota bacterium]
MRSGLVLLVVPALLALVLGGQLPELEFYLYEHVLLFALLAARVLWTWLRGLRLLPLLDLPLLGVVFVFTGAGESPLDPALFLIYALLAFYLERSPRPSLGARNYAVFLGGFVGMYGIVLLHVLLAQHEVIAGEEERLAAAALSLKAPLEGPLFERADTDAAFLDLRARIDASRADDPVIAAQAYFAPAGGGPRAAASFDGFYETYVSCLEERVRLLREAAAALDAATPWEQASERKDALAERFLATDERIDAAVGELAGALQKLSEDAWSARAAPAPAQWFDTLLAEDPYRTLDRTRTALHEIRNAFDGYFQELHGLALLRSDLKSTLKRMLSQRLAILIMVLATLSLMAGLRFNFEAEVRRREAERAAREVIAKERETDNWIALTAGLTHTIGNDILAYDAYGEEALEALAACSAELPPEIERNLRFIYESNKARLGFIKFLDEFARARKRSLDAAPPRRTGLAEIAIEPLLRAARRQVGEVEVADLPRDSKDPQVRAQRAKFSELPLEVVFCDGGEERSFQSGQRGILHFFCYELIKNALRNCSGRVPLKVEVRKGGGRVRLAFMNDLAVHVSEGRDGRRLFRLPRITTMKPCPEEEFRRQVDEILEHGFEPGRGGGTGLGLFLIRYFAREYYRGSVRARVADWERRLVAFELDLPDDLEGAAQGGTGEQGPAAVL